MPVIIQEHRASDVVALQLWVRAGGRDEAAAELGLAHYLEHMLFKGTATRPPGFIERDVEGVGGRINAGTSWDYTFYHTVLPARQAVAGIEMLADVGVNASLEAELLEAEKQVVLEEMRLNEDSPRRFLVRQLFASAYEGHPYGRPVIGRPELITALSRDTLRVVLPPPLRPRDVHAGRGRRGEPRRDPPRRPRHARLAAARRRQATAAAAAAPRCGSVRVETRCARVARRSSAWPGTRRAWIMPTRRRSTCSCRSSGGPRPRAWWRRCASGRASSARSAAA